MKRFVWIIGTIVGLCAVIAVGWWSVRALSTSADTAVRRDVSTEKAEKRSITQSIELSGEVKPALMTPIKSEISGRIAQVRVTDGERVTAGTTLIEIDQSTLLTEREQVEREAQSVRLRVERARREFERMKSLHAQAFVSDRDFQNAETDCKLEENNLLVQEARLKQVQEKLTKTTIAAPHDGIVIRLGVVAGQVITGVDGMAGGTSLMELVDLTRLVISGEANEIDASHISNAMPATVTFDSVPGVTVEGTVKYVSPAAKAAEKNSPRVFPVEIACPASDARIKPGITAVVRIPFAEVTDAVCVRLSAVFSESTNRVIYVKKGGGFTNRVVYTGINDIQYVQITTGLVAGEEIALQRPPAFDPEAKKDKKK